MYSQENCDLQAALAVVAAFRLTVFPSLWRVIVGTTFNIVFISSNSPVRAHIAEALLNHAGRGRFHAFGLSDGANESVHPEVIHILESKAIPVAGIAATPLAGFAIAQAPQVDLVCMLFDPFAGESAPKWNGEQLTAEWHIADPIADLAASEIELQRRIAATYHQLERRIALLINLPIERLDALAVQQRFGEIHDLSTRTS
jgi:arsenate reductase (thioredoxin)